MSLRPFPDHRTAQLFSDDSLQRLLPLYSGGLLSIHDLENLLTHIHAEDFAPVDAITLDELLYELFLTDSDKGTPSFASLRDPAVVQ